MSEREQRFRMIASGHARLGIGLLLGHLLYVGVGWYVSATRPAGSVESPTTTIYVFAALAIVVIAAIPLVRRAMFFSKLSTFSSQELLAKLFITNAVSVILAFVAALFGLLAVFLGAPFAVQAPFAALGIVATVLCYPNVPRHIHEWEQATNGTWTPPPLPDS